MYRDINYGKYYGRGRWEGGGIWSVIAAEVKILDVRCREKIKKGENAKNCIKALKSYIFY